MTLTRRRLLGRAAGLTGAVLLGGCGDDAQDTLSRAREVGSIRVGHANEAPYGYLDDAGRLTGYSVEVARQVLARLGIPRVEGVATEFGSLLADLGSGAFDVVAAGMFVTPERCRRALFGRPEYCTEQALLVRRGPLEDVRSFAALAARDATLGTLGGSAEVALARGAGIPAEQVREYPDKEAMRAALVGREVDALALTSISLRALARRVPARRFVLTGPVAGPGAAPPSCGAAAFRRADRRLRDAYDRELGALARTGRLAAIGRRFGLDADETAPPRAAARC